MRQCWARPICCWDTANTAHTKLGQPLLFMLTRRACQAHTAQRGPIRICKDHAVNGNDTCSLWGERPIAIMAMFKWRWFAEEAEEAHRWVWCLRWLPLQVQSPYRSRLCWDRSFLSLWLPSALSRSLPDRHPCWCHRSLRAHSDGLNCWLRKQKAGSRSGIALMSVNRARRGMVNIPGVKLMQPNPCIQDFDELWVTSGY